MLRGLFKGWGVGHLSKSNRLLFTDYAQSYKRPTSLQARNIWFTITVKPRSAMYIYQGEKLYLKYTTYENIC